MPAFSRFLALRIINYFKPLSSLSLNISLLRFPTYMCVCVSVCFCAEHISTFWQNVPCRFVFKTNFQNQYLPKVFCIPNNLAKQLARQPESKSGGRGKSIEFVVATAAKQIVNK